MQKIKHQEILEVNTLQKKVLSMRNQMMNKIYVATCTNSDKAYFFNILYVNPCVHLENLSMLKNACFYLRIRGLDFHLSPGKSGDSIKSSASIAPTAHISVKTLIYNLFTSKYDHSRANNWLLVCRNSVWNFVNQLFTCTVIFVCTLGRLCHKGQLNYWRFKHVDVTTSSDTAKESTRTHFPPFGWMSCCELAVTYNATKKKLWDLGAGHALLVTILVDTSRFVSYEAPM